MAVGQYIDGAQRDGVKTRIDVSIEDGIIVLDVASAQRKRRTEIRFPLEDLRTVLGQEQSEPMFDPLAGDAPASLVELDPVGLDPDDATQILGVPGVQEDFGPPQK